jgi:FtsZ-interacting cell division protein ZipA
MNHRLQELNNTLSTEYGLPTWLSYGLFAIGTIVLGAVVGLILVCIIDFIWPQKPTHRQSFSQVQEKDRLKQPKEVDNDDLVDDTGADQDDSETSEAEKNSGSDNEEEEEEEEEKEEEPSPKASPDVRKRRARKAD